MYTLADFKVHPFFLGLDMAVRIIVLYQSVMDCSRLSVRTAEYSTHSQFTLHMPAHPSRFNDDPALKITPVTVDRCGILTAVWMP